MGLLGKGWPFEVVSLLSFSLGHLCYKAWRVTDCLRDQPRQLQCVGWHISWGPEKTATTRLTETDHAGQFSRTADNTADAALTSTRFSTFHYEQNRKFLAVSFTKSQFWLWNSNIDSENLMINNWLIFVSSNISFYY